MQYSLEINNAHVCFPLSSLADLDSGIPPLHMQTSVNALHSQP